MFFIIGYGICGGRRRCYGNGGKEFGGDIGFKSPFFVIIGAHRQTCGAILMRSEIGKTFSGIDGVAIIAQMIFSGEGVSFIGNSIGRAIYPACFAVIAKLSYAGIDGSIES
jgi:hypothetical protein